MQLLSLLFIELMSYLFCILSRRIVKVEGLCFDNYGTDDIVSVKVFKGKGGFFTE